MNIRIVGPGVVGRATGEFFRRYGHEVDYSDEGENPYQETGDIYFICTPEEAVPEVVAELIPQLKNNSGIWASVVVRSTTPPGTIKALADSYTYEIIHNPEFLREASAEQDVATDGHAILGIPNDHTAGESFTTVSDLYESTGLQVVTVSSTASELLKLITNSYLATIISFWNEVSQICDGLEINSHLVGRLATLDPRITPYGALMHGSAYGGNCLPKDLEQLTQFARTAGHPTTLLEAVELVNILFTAKATQFDEVR